MKNNLQVLISTLITLTTYQAYAITPSEYARVIENKKTVEKLLNQNPTKADDIVPIEQSLQEIKRFDKNLYEQLDAEVDSVIDTFTIEEQEKVKQIRERTVKTFVSEEKPSIINAPTGEFIQEVDLSYLQFTPLQANATQEEATQQIEDITTITLEADKTIKLITEHFEEKIKNNTLDANVFTNTLVSFYRKLKEIESSIEAERDVYEKLSENIITSYINKKSTYTFTITEIEKQIIDTVIKYTLDKLNTTLKRFFDSEQGIVPTAITSQESLSKKMTEVFLLRESMFSLATKATSITHTILKSIYSDLSTSSQAPTIYFSATNQEKMKEVFEIHAKNIADYQNKAFDLLDSITNMIADESSINAYFEYVQPVYELMEAENGLIKHLSDMTNDLKTLGLPELAFWDYDQFKEDVKGNFKKIEEAISKLLITRETIDYPHITVVEEKKEPITEEHKKALTKLVTTIIEKEIPKFANSKNVTAEARWRRLYGNVVPSSLTKAALPQNMKNKIITTMNNLNDNNNLSFEEKITNLENELKQIDSNFKN